MKLLLIFIALNVLNVIIQTVKSIATIKCGKWGASIANMVAYGLYTVVIIYMYCDLPLWAKVLVVGLANLFGVLVVKTWEEKMRKDRLWKVETTISANDVRDVSNMLISADISFSIIPTVTDEYAVFNIYCPTQKESIAVNEILKKFNAKYFVSESKIL